MYLKKKMGKIDKKVKYFLAILPTKDTTEGNNKARPSYNGNDWTRLLL